MEGNNQSVHNAILELKVCVITIMPLPRLEPFKFVRTSNPPLPRNELLCRAQIIHSSSQSINMGSESAEVRQAIEPVPLAIVGLAFELPGGVTSEAVFWQMLYEGRCTSTDFPRDRLNVDAFYHPGESRPSSVSQGFDILYILKPANEIADSPPWRPFLGRRPRGI